MEIRKLLPKDSSNGECLWRKNYMYDEKYLQTVLVNA